MRRTFNQGMYNYLLEHGKEHTTKEWVDILNLKYNETFNLGDIQRYFARHHIEYKKHKNMQRDMGKLVPIGTEYIKPKENMTLVKVAKNKWVYKQRLVYEKYYNVKLNSDDFIIFLDGNRQNFNIDNLKLIKRCDSAYMLSNRLFSTDKEVTNTGTMVARLYYKIKDKEIEYE